MSQTQLSNNHKKRQIPFGWIVLVLVGLFTGALVLLYNSPFGAGLHPIINRLFALNSVQSMWYLTRAAGITAYLLLWFSTALGLAVASKILDTLLHRTFTFDFHEFISLLALGFLGLHIFVLMADKYLPYTLAQVFIPFLSPYRPLWVGIGVIAMYLSLLVTVTFYIRQKISMKTFRAIHVFSLVAYLGATVHGFFSGTDSSLPVAMLMYFSTFLVIVFLMVYWLVAVRIKGHPAKVESTETQPSLKASHSSRVNTSQKVHSRS
jgi:sulfoxide reductase heme-binding subunit YedZ